MGRFRKLSHTIWYCQYHIVWTPKYRYMVLSGPVAVEAEQCVRAFCQQQDCELVEINVQVDHVHLLAMVFPKISLSDFVETIKGRTAIRIFNKFKHLKTKPYWGNHFWSRGYCVDTVGLDADKIRKYVKYQEDQERRHER